MDCFVIMFSSRPMWVSQEQQWPCISSIWQCGSSFNLSTCYGRSMVCRKVSRSHLHGMLPVLDLTYDLWRFQMNADTFWFRIFRDVFLSLFLFEPTDIYISWSTERTMKVCPWICQYDISTAWSQNFFVFYYFAATTRLRSKIWARCLNPISSLALFRLAMLCIIDCTSGYEPNDVEFMLHSGQTHLNLVNFWF